MNNQYQNSVSESIDSVKKNNFPFISLTNENNRNFAF